MTSRVNYTQPGTGTAISTEEESIEGVLQQLQRVKIGIGRLNQYQGDLSYGQNISGSSIPVVIATDQIYSVTPPPTGVNPGLLTRIVGPIANNLGQKATYMSSTSSSIQMSISNNATSSMAYLWHPNSVTKRISLQKVLVSFSGGLSGVFNLFINRITAENAFAGGLSQIVNNQDQDDPISTCIFRTSSNIPTRVSGDYICMSFNGASEGYVDLVDILEGKGFICRASQNEGWEVRTVGSGLAISPNFGITFVWAES